MREIESRVITMKDDASGDKAYRRVGVTHSIRDKLKFHDERKWKRFSARRLELIDTLDLSSKKASEQEAEISKVAEALRIEFEYSTDYVEDFDRLVRAAIQSVRRNRKRSSKKNGFGTKMQRLDSGLDGSMSPYAKHEAEDAKDSKNFVSEITKLNSDSQDEYNDYSRIKHISDYDKSRAAIDFMVKPRIKLHSPLTTLKPSPNTTADLTKIRNLVLHYFERSRTCSEAISKPTPNLEFIGRGIVMASVGYVFEKSFASTNERSLEYLRNKMTLELYLANFYRDLDPVSTRTISLNDNTAVTTLYALLGGCVKDFGFEAIMLHLCELIYLTVIKEYPLMAQNSEPFKASNFLGGPPVTLSYTRRPSSTTHTSSSSQSPAIIKSDSFLQLDSLAALATDIRQRERGPAAPSKKDVSLRFLSSTLHFTFLNISAIPKLDELLENARSAFHLSLYNESQVLGLKNMKDGFIVKSDADLERVFLTDNTIELELFTQKPHAVPIYEITSMVVPNKYRDDPQKIILPPPARLAEQPPVPFKFLSNQEDTPPPALLPKFQPLL